MYTRHLQYVKDYLIKNGGYYPPNPQYNFRCKYEHTLRVLHWCKILAEENHAVDKEILYLAAIFHDIAYSGNGNNSNHAEKSANVFYEYAKENDMDSTLTEKVVYLIKLHSNKELLQESSTLPELIILMEADLLDEEGALRIIWYCATKGIQGANSYRDLYDYIQMGTDKRLTNPMVTPLARKIWEDKYNFVNEFSKELLFDIDTNVSFL